MSSASREASSFDWGGQIGYLWRGVVGGEFLANFTPSLGINTVGVLFDNPKVSSYMVNAVGVSRSAQGGRFSRTSLAVWGASK